MTTHRIPVVLFAVLIAGGSMAQEAANRPPVVKHDPIKVAVRGQPIAIRAMVMDDSGKIKSVTLFYSTSRDAAPFKEVMQGAGAGSFVGMIPEKLVSGMGQISYYIEALDEMDAATETPWYTVKIQADQASGGGVEPPPPLVKPARPKAAPAPVSEQKSSWKKPALITGLIGAGIAGGLIVANAGDSGGSASGDAGSNAGVYEGTATRYLEIPGQPLEYDNYAFQVTVAQNGAVTSDDLHEGVHLEGLLLGQDFLLTSPINETDYSGEIRYVGTVLNGRITGAIEGTVTTIDGTAGTYSGTFNAVRP